MGGLNSPRTAGHTGFTGTSIVIDPESRSFAILLSNRVHPTRTWGSTNPSRRAVGDALAKAMAVRAPGGALSWYSGIEDASTATLSTPVLTPSGSLRLSYDTFVDTAAGDDFVSLQSSADGVHWPVPVTLTGPGAPGGSQTSLSGGDRSWWHAAATVPDSPSVQLRWVYTTEPAGNGHGRGVNIAGLLVTDDHGVLLDVDRHPNALTGSGWQLTDR